MKQLFHLKENASTVPAEIRAGLTTFFAMAYIIFVNPVFLSATGMDTNGVMIATCLGAAIGTLLCALISNRPFALAPGMGMNAFFAYTLCLGYGYSWQQALALVFLSGILFLIAAIIFREKAALLIPANMKYAITVGIGFLITLIGLLDGGLIDLSTSVPALADLRSPSILITLTGLIITMILTVLNVTGSLILGMTATLILSLVCGLTALPSEIIMAPTALSTVFLKLSFTGLLPEGNLLSGLASLAALILTMSIVDMFDTIGYLVGTGSRAGLTDADGNTQGMEKIIIADAGATILGSLCGTSTVTVYAESTAGIAAGGKTGLTAITTAICFLAAMFFSPLAGMFSASVTAPALIIVGMYLMMDIRKLHLESLADAIPALLTIITIPMTYSITSGLGLGFISYMICQICAGRGKQLKKGSWILTVIFAVYFILA